jgi:hypothetical protein
MQEAFQILEHVIKALAALIPVSTEIRAWLERRTAPRTTNSKPMRRRNRDRRKKRRPQVRQP